jgi:predicted peptidase
MGSYLTRLPRVSLIVFFLMLCLPMALIAQKKYAYLSYLPDQKVASQKLPLIIYLHGSSQRGNNLDQLKTYGLPKFLEQGGKINALVVAPQCPNGLLWDSEEWFPAFLKELQQKFAIDTDRIYLTGVSMGGGGTFEIAKKYPQIFAAIAPLCAWQSSTQNLCKLSKIPIWTLHGEKDYVVPIQQTEEKIAVLKKCHPKVTYTILPDEGHSIHWIYEKPDRYNLYEWLLQYRKSTN